jgi:hypothetical protein
LASKTECKFKFNAHILSIAQFPLNRLLDSALLALK